MISVFTPTYNRAATLPRLYQSLEAQTFMDLEWIVVDDGSTDSTEELVQSWIPTAPFAIKFIKQANGGKHRAINTGVKAASGDLFFIVDSDDYLTTDAIEWITATARPIMGDERYAGLSGTRIDKNGHRIGGDSDFDSIDADAMAIRYKHHIAGDLAEIYKTEILREYPFPDIEGEKFCTEGLVWARIARTRIMRYVNKGIYVGEYLAGGLTDNSIRCRMNSPRYAMLTYSEFVKHRSIPFIGRVRYYINYWLYSFNSLTSFKSRLDQIGLRGLPFAPIGYIFYLRFKKVSHK